MARKSIYKNRREQAYDRIYEVVSAADSYAGKRLMPVKAMAQTFGVSVRTVQLAMEQLEKEGYVQRRHGVGTFISWQTLPVAASDYVAVAMPVYDEVWGPFAASIIAELHASGRLPIAIITQNADGAALLHRAARGDINTFILHGRRWFPFHVLEQPAFRGKQILAVDEWASAITPLRMHQVLHDYAYGGQQLAEHLFKRGHRRVVIVGASGSIQNLTHRDGILCGASRGHAFIDYWTARGGTWTTLTVTGNSDLPAGSYLEPNALIDMLTGPNPATAIFGFRDVEGWLAQSVLREHRPNLLDRVEIVGYGDTLWSRIAQPPLTTVAYPVREMVQWIHQLFAAGAEGSDGKNDIARCVLIRPRLIDRSRPMPGAAPKPEADPATSAAEAIPAQPS